VTDDHQRLDDWKAKMSGQPGGSGQSSTAFLPGMKFGRLSVEDRPAAPPAELKHQIKADVEKRDAVREAFEVGLSLRLS